MITTIGPLLIVHCLVFDHVAVAMAAAVTAVADWCVSFLARPHSYVKVSTLFKKKS
jgi:hypothetical protein